MDISIHEAELTEQKGRRLTAAAILVAITVVGSTWFALVTFLGANSAHGTIEDLREQWIPDVGSMVLDLPDLSRLSSVYTADGVLLGQLTERNSQPTVFDEIPNLVIGAVLSAEDQDFMEHSGIDFQAIVRALVEDLRGGPQQGGSTITQQVVKQNFVGNEPTLQRKVTEATIAIELERRFTKEQILEYYLNSIYFGANAYGVTAAAQEYFGKTLDQLTIAEAAAITIPIRNPSLYNLRNRSAIPLRARNAVIDNMVEEGYITTAEGEAAKDEPIRTVVHEESIDLAPQVLMAARDSILNDARDRYGLGATPLQRKRAVFGCPADDTECAGGGGLKIFTTVDQHLQEEARRILQEWFPPGTDLPTGAIAMVDNRTGATLVMASGLDFGTDLEAGQRQYDLATKGRRNPGSAFKPFGAIAALEQGIPLNSYWDMSTPQTLDYGGIEPWKCANASTNQPGIRTLEAALYLSTNTVFCQVSIAVGPENIVDVAHRMGIKSSLSPVPAIVLGAQAVSPLEMASAFSTIANQGLRVDNYLIERIEDADGNVIYQHQVAATQVLEPALGAAILNTLEKAVAIGTGRNADIERPQFGKTGTHESYRDAWFVGGIPQVTTSVWVGYPDAQREMRGVAVKPDRDDRETIPKMFGSSAPAPIWAEFMTIVVADMAVEDFAPDPPGIEVYYTTPRVAMPDVIGFDLDDAEEAVLKAGLAVEVELVNSEEPAGKVVGTDPGPGERIRQGTSAVVEVSNGLSPTVQVPNLIGSTQAAANDALAQLRQSSNVDFSWVFEDVTTGDPANDGLVQAMVPGPGTVIDEEDVIVVTVWRYSP